MSDQSQGQDWWQASDGKWYPPEQHPDSAVGATQAMDQQPAGPPPTSAMPPVPPPGAPIGPPPAGPVGPPPGAGPNNNAKWIAVGVVAALIVAIAAFLLLRDDDDTTNLAATSSSPSESTSDTDSSESSSRSTRSSSSSSSSTSSSSSSSGALTKSDIDARLVRAKDLGGDFQDETFTPDDNSTPTPCGTPNPSSQVPPKIDTGNDMANGVAFLEEEVLVHNSATDADKWVQLFLNSASCPEPTIQEGEPVQLSGPNDVASDLDVKADDAIEFDLQTTEAQGKIFVIRLGNVIVTYAFVAQQGADTSQLPNEIDVVNLGLNRLVA
jgi:hypothetical protein